MNGVNERIYDPLLDRTVEHRETQPPIWNARWIWYPGQCAAHALRKVFRTAATRVAHIGYPGNFNEPVDHLHLRYAATLAGPTLVRWAAPTARVRLVANGKGGDVTERSRQLEAGPCRISVAIDLTTDLPCLLLEGEGLASGEGWEASLDGESWVDVECDDDRGSPDQLPTDGRDERFVIGARSMEIANGRREDGISLDAGSRILVDFWHDELCELSIVAQGEATLSVRVGESVAEVENADTSLMEQYPIPPVAVGTGLTQIRLPERALRYAIIETDRPCRVERITAEARIYPSPVRGQFECDDERLCDIFQAGAATVRSCIHGGVLLDGIKRDACVWLKDQNIGFDAVHCLFLDRPLVRNTLLGRTLPLSPSIEDVGTLDMDLYCVLGFEQDYLLTGDRSFIERHRERITDILDLCESLLDERGFFSAPPWSGSGEWLAAFSPDWGGCSAGAPRDTDIDCKGTPAYAQMMIMRCFEIGAAFAPMWGDASRAERYSRIARKIRHSIRANFWDAKRGAFITGFDRNGVPDRRITQYAQKWALLFDLVDEADVGRAMAALDGAIRPSNVSMSTYYEYLARIKYGAFADVILRIRRIWGEILDLGFSRLPEDLKPGSPASDYLSFYGRPFGMSLNHLWAGATPVAILMRGALGFSIDTPGCRIVRLSPNWELFGWMRCTLPTPLGDLSLDYCRDRGAVLTIPEGMSVVIGENRHEGGRSVRIQHDA